MNDNLLDGLPEGSPDKIEPTRLVGVDDNGNRVGEDHPRAKLTDHEVDLIRELHEGGGLSLREIAEKFEVSKSTIRDVTTFRRRASYPTGWKRVKLVVNGHERVGDCSAVEREDVSRLV